MAAKGVSGASGGSGSVTGNGDAGDDPALAAIVYECYACELLSVNPAELAALDYETVEVHVGWSEGRAVGEWAQAHPQGEE